MGGYRDTDFLPHVDPHSKYDRADQSKWQQNMGGQKRTYERTTQSESADRTYGSTARSGSAEQAYGRKKYAGGAGQSQPAATYEKEGSASWECIWDFADRVWLVGTLVWEACWS